mmetsp:Transcript_46437/g.120118  ORF Transcript_46437/g.120118 Transcript_46437/m.120118 type:complete len:298 (-) Transcript_46437:515-1408(-)
MSFSKKSAIAIRSAHGHPTTFWTRVTAASLTSTWCSFTARECSCSCCCCCCCCSCCCEGCWRGGCLASDASCPGIWMNCDFRWLLMSFESVAIASVESVMVRCRVNGLTQKISAMPQPGLRYSHRHLLSTLCRRSDSSSVPVCSLRSSRFSDESDVFRSLADLRPCSEGFSCSFSVPAKSTRVSAPMLVLRPPSGSKCMGVPNVAAAAPGFCTKMWTTAWEREELALQDETPAVRRARASCRRLRQMSAFATRTIWYRHFCVLIKSSSQTMSSGRSAPLARFVRQSSKSVSESPRTS